MSNAGALDRELLGTTWPMWGRSKGAAPPLLSISEGSAELHSATAEYQHRLHWDG